MTNFFRYTCLEQMATYMIYFWFSQCPSTKDAVLNQNFPFFVRMVLFKGVQNSIRIKNQFDWFDFIGSSIYNDLNFQKIDKSIWLRFQGSIKSNQIDLYIQL